MHRRTRISSRALLLLRSIIGAILLSPAYSAFGIGDSGGHGCSGLSAEFAKTTALGSPDDLADAIKKELLSREALRPKQKSTPAWIRRLFKDLPTDEAPARVNEKDVVESRICGAPGGSRPLDVAVAAGNIANVEFLLSRGADPNGVLGSMSSEGSIYSRCLRLSSVPMSNGRRLTDVPTHRVLTAYDVLLKRGGRLDIYDTRGFGPLHFCNDPAIVQYFLARGADADLSLPLDTRVYQVIHSEFLPSRKESLSIARMLANKATNRRVSRSNEYWICLACSGVKLSSECKDLSEFVEVRDKRIFVSKGDTLNANSTSHRCVLMTDPSGPLNTELRKLYDIELDQPIFASPTQ